MSVIANIRASYVRPRVVMRRLLEAGPREDRAIAMIMAASTLLFIAQWPFRAREAHLTGVPMERLFTTDLYALIFVFPLLMYILAALTRLGAKLLGGSGSWYTARLALFWSLLATAPLIVLNGMVKGFIGPGPAQSLVGAIWFAAFMIIWIQSMREAERGA